ncbi:WhiB family redox-sensing transcriptional regulator [Rhodococcus sp. 27YEA15]
MSANLNRVDSENSTTETTSVAAVSFIEVASTRRDLPCRVTNPDLWFAESPAELEQAKTLCAACPIRSRCLSAALDRAEPWGVWGGEILDQGAVIARKRPRGRPRKQLVCA